MKCKCPSASHIDECVLEHDGSLGDVCSLCYIQCKTEFDETVKIQVCRHLRYIERKSIILQLLESGDIVIPRKNLESQIRGQINWYCQECKEYCSKPEHETDLSRKVLECTTWENPACHCKVSYSWERQEDPDADHKIKFFEAHRYCTKHEFSSGRELFEVIKQHVKEHEEKRLKELELNPPPLTEIEQIKKDIEELKKKIK